MQDIRLNRILSVPAGTAETGRPAVRQPGEQSFSSIFSRELEGEPIRFSRHAQTRLESRNISLESGDLKKLGDAVDQAADKGVRDSLVLMNNLAFIVSVPDRTVVTAMPVDEAEQKVFTNIDGAVIV